MTQSVGVPLTATRSALRRSRATRGHERERAKGHARLIVFRRNDPDIVGSMRTICRRRRDPRRRMRDIGDEDAHRLSYSPAR